MYVKFEQSEVNRSDSFGDNESVWGKAFKLSTALFLKGIFTVVLLDEATLA